MYTEIWAELVPTIAVARSAANISFNFICDAFLGVRIPMMKTGRTSLKMAKGPSPSSADLFFLRGWMLHLLGGGSAAHNCTGLRMLLGKVS